MRVRWVGVTEGCSGGGGGNIGVLMGGLIGCINRVG